MIVAKSIDELYSEVCDFDLVLCNDAPLALALNNRVDHARLGRLAFTTREYAREVLVRRGDEPLISDIELVRRISDSTGYGIRFVHAEVENIRRMLHFMTDVRPYLGNRSRKVWDEFIRYRTLESVIMSFDKTVDNIYDGLNVAVINTYDGIYDNLDKFMLPMVYEEISMEGRGDYVIEEVRLLGNDKQIADCAVDIAVRSEPKNVAIVMDSSGKIADAVRSALYRSQVPFVNTLSMKDIQAVRSYLQFVRLGLDYDIVRIRDVRALISSYGGNISPRYDMYSLRSMYNSGGIDGERTLDLIRHLQNIREHTFMDVCEHCVPGSERSNIKMLLTQMGCNDRRISEALLDDLFYAVNNIGSLSHNEQIPQDELEGVLLADCKNAMYVDRAIVIYAGLGTDWDRTLKGLDFLNSGRREDENRANNERFRIMIQQGSVRYYFANATKGGEKAIPCTHFEFCLGENVSVGSFSDICGTVREGAWKIELRDRGVDHSCSDLDQTGKVPRFLSPSAFNEYYKCPRCYLFKSLTSQPDSEETYTGNKLHEYLEFRVSYPELAAQHPPEYFAELIAEKCAPLQSEEAVEIERTKIHDACRAIDRMVSEFGLSAGKLVNRSVDKKDKNIFFEMYGLGLTSEIAERKLMNSDLRMEGDCDIFCDRMIVDLKTGKATEASDLVKRLDFQEDFESRTFRKSQNADFQPFFYLALSRANGNGLPIFMYFHTTKHYESIIMGGQPSVPNCSVTVYVASDRREMLSMTPLFNQKKHENYADLLPDVFIRHGHPSQWDRPSLEEDLKGIGVKPKDLDNLIDRASKIVGNESAQVNDHEIAITADGLDRVIRLVRGSYESICEQYTVGGPGSFPAAPCISCDKCYYRALCTAEIVTGGDADE